jgi:hypothetical protein
MPPYLIGSERALLHFHVEERTVVGRPRHASGAAEQGFGQVASDSHAFEVYVADTVAGIIFGKCHKVVFIAYFQCIEHVVSLAFSVDV